MMEQYHVAAADGQTPLVMSGGHVVMQALSGQMSGGQTLQSTAGQVNVKYRINECSKHLLRCYCLQCFSV